MQATGHIAVVQEERFRLITDDGAGLLLTLSRKANASPDDLRRFHENNAHVRIDYEGEPNMPNGIARRVSRA